MSSSLLAIFNLHLDHPDDSKVTQFLAALESTNLTQHVPLLLIAIIISLILLLLSLPLHSTPSLITRLFLLITYLFLNLFQSCQVFLRLNSNFLSLLQIY